MLNSAFHGKTIAKQLKKSRKTDKNKKADGKQKLTEIKRRTEGKNGRTSDETAGNNNPRTKPRRGGVKKNRPQKKPGQATRLKEPAKDKLFGTAKSRTTRTNRRPNQGVEGPGESKKIKRRSVGGGS
ncbi:MAG: hypothetical protein LBO05_12675 [Deltaproteobacteria bacterium]|jgi:hypothetical protein|nr:hypothetical protein [Deltaproteobacteria bacterium]